VPLVGDNVPLGGVNQRIVVGDDPDGPGITGTGYFYDAVPEDGDETEPRFRRERNGKTAIEVRIIRQVRWAKTIHVETWLA